MALVKVVRISHEAEPSRTTHRDYLIASIRAQQALLGQRGHPLPDQLVSQRPPGRPLLQVGVGTVVGSDITQMEEEFEGLEVVDVAVEYLGICALAGLGRTDRKAPEDVAAHE